MVGLLDDSALLCNYVVTHCQCAGIKWHNNDLACVLQRAESDLSHVYLAYTAEGAEQALRPKSGKAKSARPKTANNRPKSSRK